MKNLLVKAGLNQVYTNHCLRHTVVEELDDEGIETRHMVTTGHKSETSIRNYTKRCPPKRRRQISDLLAKRLVEEVETSEIAEQPEPKKKKTIPTSTVSVPTENQNVVNAVNAPVVQIDEPMPLVVPNENQENNLDMVDEIPDDQILEVLTQIEKENKSYLEEMQKPKEVNLSYSNINNIINVRKGPMMPTMYSPNSNVNIHYHFDK